jgi:hypothetical protein
MTLYAPFPGEALLLQYITNIATPTNIVMHLYTNDMTPAWTLPANPVEYVGAANGYTAITLTGSSWTTTFGTGLSTALYSTPTFNFSTGATVFGYFCTSTAWTAGAQNTILWVERFWEPHLTFHLAVEQSP